MIGSAMIAKGRRALVLSTVLAAALVLPGCISLLPETEPSTLYRLEAVRASSAQSPETATPVIIDRLAAPRGLSGDRVAIVRNGSVAYMAGAAWLSPAPTLVHNQILDMFLVETPELVPTRSEDGVDSRYQLQLELRRFEAEYEQGDGAAPMVHVRLQARLIDRDTRRLIGLRQIHEDVLASENRQSAIISAFSQATNAAVRELAGWTSDEVEAAERDS